MNTQTKEEDKISSFLGSLEQLNSYLPQEKRIKMIIFLWSRFSPKCKELIQSMPPLIKQFFYFINIDNPRVRKSILNSSTVKVSEVPSVVISYLDGVTSTYEGSSTIEIIKNIYQIVQKNSPPAQQVQQPRHQPPPPPPAQQAPPKKRNNTPLSEIIGGGDKIFDEEEGGDTLIDEEDDDYEDESRHTSVRSKIKGAKIPMDHNKRIRSQNIQPIGLSSARVLPKKGMGHEGMATSSLGAIDIKREEPTIKPVQIDDGEVLDENLEDILDEDATIDPVIKSTKSNGGDKKEAMMSVKKAAEEMMRMREEQDEN